MKASTFLSLTAGIALLLATPAFAQPGGGDRGGFGGRGFGGPGGGGMSGLLMNEQVQDEIELVEEQKAELRDLAEEIRDDMRSEMGSLFQGMRDLSEDERREKFGEIRTKMESFQKQAESKIEEVLLPHQFERLKQLNVQQQINGGGGGATGLLQGPLADELGITDEQREEMMAKSQELQADVEKKIQKLREEAREELMSVLTPEQRSKLEKMAGDRFDLPPGGGFRGDRGPGGPRGGQGGRPARGSDQPDA